MQHVVERTQRIENLDEVVITTTVEPNNDVIEDFCKQKGYRCFRGHRTDVLNQYYRAATKMKADIVVRITGDCPLIDPDVAGQASSKLFEVPQADYTNNCMPTRTFPRGLDNEWMTYEALEKAWIYDEDNAGSRVHVTPYIYRHPELFRLRGLENPINYSHYRWTVDEQADLDAMRAIFSHFDSNNFSWEKVIGLLKQKPELAMINESVRQKELKEG